MHRSIEKNWESHGSKNECDISPIALCRYFFMNVECHISYSILNIFNQNTPVNCNKKKNTPVNIIKYPRKLYVISKLV